MTETNWTFNDSPTTMVLTTRDVIHGRRHILFVSHDSDDGMWQFHGGEDVNMDDAMLVSLKEIVENDITITNLADLPLGWIAWRDNILTPWTKNESNG